MASPTLPAVWTEEENEALDDSSSCASNPYADNPDSHLALGDNCRQETRMTGVLLIRTDEVFFASVYLDITILVGKDQKDHEFYWWV